MTHEREAVADSLLGTERPTLGHDGARLPVVSSRPLVPVKSRVSADELAALERLADEQLTSVSKIVRLAVRDYVAHRDNKDFVRDDDDLEREAAAVV